MVTLGASCGVLYVNSQHEPVPPLPPLALPLGSPVKEKEPIWLLLNRAGLLFVFCVHGCSGSGPTPLSQPTRGSIGLKFNALVKLKSVPSVARKFGLSVEPHVPPGDPGHVSSN